MQILNQANTKGTFLCKAEHRLHTRFTAYLLYLWSRHMTTCISMTIEIILSNLPFSFEVRQCFLIRVSLQETIRKTHLGANRQINFLTNIIFFLKTQRRKKKRISISILIHIYIEMNPDANEQNGVFLNWVPELHRGMNRKLTGEYQSLSSMSVISLQVGMMGWSKCKDHKHNLLCGICIWFHSPRPLGKQSCWISKHFERIHNIRTKALACDSSLPHFLPEWGFFYVPLCPAVLHWQKRDLASSIFKCLLCQIWLWIHKGKHITWNQIQLMTFCRIHSSLVVWHFDDGAWGTQHNK